MTWIVYLQDYCFLHQLLRVPQDPKLYAYNTDRIVIVYYFLIKVLHFFDFFLNLTY